MVFLIHQKRQHTCQRFFEDLGDGEQIEMVLIRGGTFMMGSPEDEEGRKEREGPHHKVTVPTFLMGRYPVTQAQWYQVASFEPIDVDIEFPSSPSEFSGEEDSSLRPVESVNWYQAKEFCDRLSLYTKRTYRLPSEAEWEYACRAGTTTPFYCGETISTQITNYNGNYVYGRGVSGEYIGQTTRIDSFPPSHPWGLCDMHGNVWEWCQDHWHDDYRGALSNGRPWIEESLQNNKYVVRGGSWRLNPEVCRSAYRNRGNADNQDYNVGFRVVLAPR